MAALFIPSDTKDGAIATVAGIEAGRIPSLPEYCNETIARARFDRYPIGYRALLSLWKVENGEASRVAVERFPGLSPSIAVPEVAHAEA